MNLSAGHSRHQPNSAPGAASCLGRCGFPRGLPILGVRCNPWRPEGDPSAEHIPPLVLPAPRKFVFWRTRGANGRAVKTREAVVSGSWQSSCIYGGRWLQLSLKTPKPPFLSFLPLFSKPTGAGEVIWAHKHQARSSHGNSKLPPQPCIHSISKATFQASMRVLRATHTTTLESNLPSPLHAGLKGMGEGRSFLAETLVMGSTRDYKSNESCLYNKFELGRICPVEGFQA